MTSPAANEASHLRNAWTMVGPLAPHFGGQGTTMSNRPIKPNEALESQLVVFVIDLCVRYPAGPLLMPGRLSAGRRPTATDRVML